MENKPLSVSFSLIVNYLMNLLNLDNSYLLYFLGMRQTRRQNTNMSKQTCIFIWINSIQTPVSQIVKNRSNIEHFACVVAVCKEIRNRRFVFCLYNGNVILTVLESHTNVNIVTFDKYRRRQFRSNNCWYSTITGSVLITESNFVSNKTTFI